MGFSQFWKRALKLHGNFPKLNILWTDVGANLSVYANPMYTSTLGIFGKQRLDALLVQVIQG